MSKPRQYSSTRSSRARKIVAAQLPTNCYRCNRIVTADMKWEADHPMSRVQAEALGISEHEQDQSVVAAHASCNHKAGASLGNAMKAKPRTEQRKITRIKRAVSFSGETTNTPRLAPQVFSPVSSQEAQNDS